MGCVSVVKRSLMVLLVVVSIPLGGFMSHSSRCSTTSVAKAMVCTVTSVGWCILKMSFLRSVLASFISRYLSGP